MQGGCDFENASGNAVQLVSATPHAILSWHRSNWFSSQVAVAEVPELPLELVDVLLPLELAGGSAGACPTRGGSERRLTASGAATSDGPPNEQETHHSELGSEANVHLLGVAPRRKGQ